MIMHESAEMYLETIYVLSQENETVRAVDIATRMGYSKPTISEWMSKLVEAGYVQIDNAHISLTAAGLQVAERVYERHVVLEDFLNKLGVNPEQAEEDACRIEHYISDETFQALKAFSASMKQVEP